MPSGRQHQAGLADARRALEQQQRTAPGDRVSLALVDPGQSGVSLQKRLSVIHRSPVQIVTLPKLLGPPPQKQVACHGAVSIRPQRSCPQNDSTKNRTKEDR
jgi:hypothetical protein